MALWVNSTILDRSLMRLSTLTSRIALCTTDPTTRQLATSTAFCCGTKIIGSSGFGARVASSDVKVPKTSGRAISIKKTSDIAGRKCTTHWITHVVLISDAPSTMIYITKCSSRSYSTAGPDKITASSWYVHMLNPATST